MLDNALERRPPQQTGCSEDEAPHDDLILVAVSLEAQGDDVFLRGIFAKVNALAQAERLCAFRAGRRWRSRLWGAADMRVGRPAVHKRMEEW
ncbi:hypothetical protein AAL_01990 [Moelleriella libera RCEF 2490]|uniref:Uncharacterized protein n=1 Tax=Moelleriella libera RCEF 2490 TaxID=1081109 RepID=A0A168F2Z1_9HYPO|nr:hypothetical protein AAL_01990 [Moelleriella libera RCEF 2490]